MSEFMRVIEVGDENFRSHQDMYERSVKPLIAAWNTFVSEALKTKLENEATSPENEATLPENEATLPENEKTPEHEKPLKDSGSIFEQTV